MGERAKGTYVRVPEQRVVTPGEGLGAPVQVVVGRGLRHLASVLVLDVLDVGSMLSLGVVDPGGADSNCFMSIRIHGHWKQKRLTAGEANVVAGNISQIVCICETKDRRT